MRRKWFFPAVAVLAVLAVLALLWPSADGYAVHGVDVSHYQGEIDFQRLADQGMRFVFIKATEGSSYVDERLEANIIGAEASSLRAGYYHFFSYDSPGVTQAENFIDNIPKHDGMLPPVIDVEFYGDYYKNPAPAKTVVPELRSMVNALEAHYGMKPILYCTHKAYWLYVRKLFDDCDLWYRSTYWKPVLDRKWTFWQFTDKAKMDGYDGEEPCIDVNAFCGTEEEFMRYPGR